MVRISVRATRNPSQCSTRSSLLTDGMSRFTVRSVRRELRPPTYWTYDLSTRVFSRLTARAASCCLSWMPDGRRIAYRPILNGRWNELWWVPSDGAGREEPFYVAPENSNVVDPTFSPDSRFAVFTANSAGSRAPTGAWAGSGKPSSEDLWLVSLAHRASDRQSSAAARVPVQ